MSLPDQPQAGSSPLRRALVKLDELQAKIDALEQARREPLAIVGMACRFPGGARNPAAFWDLLSAGVDAVREMPGDRWDVDAYYDPTPGVPGKMYTRHGAFLDRVDEFDPQHFGIAPREAISMDPQQRLLLEVTWEALEHAGHAPDRLSGSRTGVFVGICRSDYSQLQIKLNDPERFDAYQASGCAHSIASGRLSYVLGLQGPSVSLDTACSSSLVAIHLASQSLRAGECRTAIVGGVNLILAPENTLTFCQSTMVSRDGRCRTFDAAAEGFAQGEGCGVLVVKRLSDARADRDHVHALILGTAVNQDGPSSGLTAPNGPAQEAMLREALANGGVAPHQIGYVEAHGTATSLGDPIEVQALGSVMREGRAADRPLLIGSVKTNIGHLEAAAGVAGVIKVVLSLQHRSIPPHLHFTTPNPHIAWDGLPVEVATTLRQWQPIEGRRIAGVSSFGFSGTNAHVVIEEAADDVAGAAAGDGGSPAQLCTVSARSEAALTESCRNLSRWIEDNPGARLGDVCFTANAGRASFGYRAAFVAHSTADLGGQLLSVVRGASVDGVFRGHADSVDPPKLAFLFTGQGSQYAGMGRALFAREPVFRDVLTRCDGILRDHLPVPLLSVLHPESGGVDPERWLDQTLYTQPALFAIEYALAELWRSWGIRPSHVMGHSVGEYVAACVAGVFSLEDGLALIARRARLMQALPAGGRMAAIFATEERVARALTGAERDVTIAAVNGPEHIVVSGRAASVEAVVAALQREGVRAKFLNVSHAFHSPLMAPAVQEFERAAAGVASGPPRISIISNLTGDRAGRSDMADPQYWGRHVLEPVRFSDSVATLRRLGCNAFLEIGPDPVLLGMAARCPGTEDALWLPSLRKGQDDSARLLSSLSELYVRGVDVGWERFHQPHAGQRIALPTYPFERERYWFEETRTGSPAKPARAAATAETHPLLGTRLDTARSTIFTARIDTEAIPFLADHVVHGHAVLPTTAYLELIGAAGSEIFGGERAAIERLSLQRALSLSDRPALLQLVVSEQDDNSAIFELFSRADAEAADRSDWTMHAAGTLRGGVPRVETPEEHRPQHVRDRCRIEVSPDAFYAGLWERGLNFGPAFRCVERLWRRDGEAIGEIAHPAALAGAGQPYRFHPAYLDACLQVLAAAAPGFDPSDTKSDVYMPTSIERFVTEAATPARLTSHGWFDETSKDHAETRTGHVRVFDETGRCIAHVSAIQMKRVDDQTLARVLGANADDWFYRVDWRRATADERPDADAPGPIEERFDRLSAMHDLALMRGAGAEIDVVVSAYIAAALRRLGWNFDHGQEVTASDLARRLGVVPRYERLLGRFLEILAEDGVLGATPGGWVVRTSPRQVDVDDLCAGLLDRYGARVPELTVTRRCGERLADVLRGEADPLALLFPGGDIDATAGIYNSTPVARTFNTLCAEAVRAELDRLPSTRPLRILEIGAGTGGTTDFVVDGVDPDRVEYVFTDIGQMFLTRAARRYSSRPFMQYRLLDIEKDPATQGFASGAYDVVIASNVLHATTDLRATLGHVRQLLDPAGVLLLLEGTAPQRWFDLTFGLTEGWWRFADRDLRPSYPLLSRPQWMSVLRETGLSPSAVPNGDVTPHALFVAAGPDRPSAGAVAADHRDCWIVLADGGGVGAGLARALRARGDGVVLVRPGDAFERPGTDAYVINPASPGDFARVVREIAETEPGRRCRGAVHLWSLDTNRVSGRVGGVGGVNKEPEPDAVSAAQLLECGSALHLTQALLQTHQPQAPALWFVTRGAQPAAGDTLSIAGAPLWGFGRVIALEHPELRCTRIDLDPVDAAHDADHVAAEIQRAAGEDQVAIRGGERLVARLVRAALHPSRQDAANTDVQPVELHVSAKGSPDHLTLRPAVRRAPGAGEVEIRVRAAGLNFRDVLNVLGMRDDTDPLGGECAGIVTRVGEGVANLAAGDEVLAIAMGAFSTFAIVRHEVVCPKPKEISFEQAAGVPLAFLTARYALQTLGGLARGERVLIHAAAGGVGLAAVRVALRAGAEVFATAGSAEKRRYLESIGVRHVMDSRSLEFAEQVQRDTAGAGVDVVLNSLTGEAIARGLSVLRDGGRFLEIGKSEIWDAGRVAAVNPRVRYMAVDLAETLHRNPASLRPLLLELVEDVARGTLEPLPVTTFGLGEAADAFRYMARARHIGKIVLVPARSSQPAGGDRGRDGIAFAADRTYLITGGFGGLGLEVARWMAAHGARHLALMGRQAPSVDAERVLADVRAAGARILALTGDVSNFSEAQSALAQIAREMPPLAGIIHAAGVLRDGVVLQQDWTRFAEVLAPKVDGAWNLHCLTRNAPLDLFVLFSSVSSLLGSPGQSNHAAANAFLDQLAHYRRARGLPAISINWGAWTEVGAAAAHGVADRIAAHGVSGFSPEKGLRAFERILKSEPAQVGVTPVDWKVFTREFLHGRIPAFLSDVAVARSPAGARPRTAGPAHAAPEIPDLRKRLDEALPAKRRQVLVAHVEQCAARVLGLSGRPLDRRLPLAELGLDSLMAVELRNTLAAAVGFALPATLLFDYPTIDALAAFLAERLAPGDPDARAAVPERAEAGADVLALIENFSDEDVERLFTGGEIAE